VKRLPAKLPPVLDACCGGRAFWFDRKDARALFMDKRQGVFPIVRKTPRSPVIVKPDWCGSFTAMPFPPGTFDHIIFDPPHLVGPNATGNIRKTYGSLGNGWREELRGGFAECFRVLRPGGTLIFKWSEYDVPVSEVLALTPEKPLYGHRSGKQARTHWVAFIKA
jgi:SAM-dependent methyltransferase